MRTFAIFSIALLAGLLTLGPVASAQQGAPGQATDATPARPGLEVPLVTPGPGWKACPHCENEGYKKEDREKANEDKRPFNAHALAGFGGGTPKHWGAM